ncbi:hypothetical protein QFC19_000408 [Naganishia cerealis]|uniref:Uncharacterized protein n=1 Tax=Naganishia cerealis TaxID=610337 RepID=A0ACC2WM80_9TREE|nr:hypothetical protein QFC19_000408 [Naganishia cerealis]
MSPATGKDTAIPTPRFSANAGPSEAPAYDSHYGKRALKRKTNSSTLRPSSATPSPTSTITSTTSTSSTSSTSAPVTSTTASSSVPPSDCSCGYVLTAYENAYYPLSILVDFSSVSSIDEFPGLGLKISTSRIGGVNADDRVTACYSDPANVRITQGGVLELVVPGGQQKGGAITGAEITSIDTMLSGHLTMTAQISAEHGTCQAQFTYIDEAGYPLAGDEQDIEMLGQTLDEGIVLTNWNPETYHTQSEGTVIPFPSPPTTSFHNYTIFWPPASSSPRLTSYYFDSQLLHTMSSYVSVHPSRAYMNHWTNGQASFTQGPPVGDAVLQVAAVAWYYSTQQVPGLPIGCTMEQACVV